MPAVALDTRASEMVRHGHAVTAGQSVSARGIAERVRLYDAAGAFMGIGESDGAGNVRPKRLFNDAR